MYLETSWGLGVGGGGGGGGQFHVTIEIDFVTRVAACGFRIPDRIGIYKCCFFGMEENPEKNPRNRNENQQQTQPTYDTW